jgi:hypothetical protein
MCAVLGITDTSRVKVVGVTSDSVNIISLIEPESISMTSSTSADDNATNTALVDLNAKLAQAISSGSLSGLLSSAGLCTVLVASSAVTDKVRTSDGTNTNRNTSTNTNTNTNTNTETTPVASKNKTVMIVGIVVGVTGFICIVFVGIVCYMKKNQ